MASSGRAGGLAPSPPSLLQICSAALMRSRDGEVQYMARAERVTSHHYGMGRQSRAIVMGKDGCYNNGDGIAVTGKGNGEREGRYAHSN